PSDSVPLLPSRVSRAPSCPPALGRRYGPCPPRDTVSEHESIHDVAVVGGGPAGLSAAIWLGRYLHRVVLVDSGDPRNCETSGINGYLGLPGVRPAELRKAGRDEARSHGATLVDGFVSRIRVEGDE